MAILSSRQTSFLAMYHTLPVTFKHVRTLVHDGHVLIFVTLPMPRRSSGADAGAGSVYVLAEPAHRQRARRGVALRCSATRRASYASRATNARNRSKTSRASSRERGGGRRRVSAEDCWQLPMDRDVLDCGAHDGLYDPELADELAL
jgi:hypothetical protein